jgi:hypothetical protein
VRSCPWARHGLTTSSTLDVSSWMLPLSTHLLELRLKFNFYKFCQLMYIIPHSDVRYFILNVVML